MTLAALTIVTGSYVLFGLALAWRAAQAAPPPRPLGDAMLPRVAVLVAARNEEDTLPRCLHALRAQDYPPERLTIWVTDDQSTDGTAAVVRRMQKTADALTAEAVPAEPFFPESEASVSHVPSPRVHLIRIPATVVSGKAHALDAAARRTDADVLLFTDADCAPPPSWARRMAERLAEPGVGLTCGLTLPLSAAHPTDTPPGAFSNAPPHAAAQTLDWALMLGAVATLTESGLPATGMGNNLGMRRETYEAVGGFAGLPRSVTEDYEMIRAVADDTPWRVRFPLEAETLVATLPTPTLRQAYRQRRRWAKGGLRGGIPVLAIYALLFLVHLLPLLGLATAPGIALLALAAKSISDATLLFAVGRRTGAPRFVWRHLPAFELALIVYLCTLPITLLVAPGIRWKQRRL